MFGAVDTLKQKCHFGEIIMIGPTTDCHFASGENFAKITEFTLLVYRLQIHR